MKNSSLLALLSLFMLGGAAIQAGDLYITLGSDALDDLSEHSLLSEPAIRTKDGIALIKVEAEKLDEISHLLHSNRGRCPGFMFHATKEEGEFELNRVWTRDLAAKGVFSDYSLTQADQVQGGIDRVSEAKIKTFLTHYSGFQTRYHQSQTVKTALNWLKSQWGEITSKRDDVTIEFFKHQSSPMDSIILTIKGKTHPEEIIVIGSHADSIARSYGNSEARSPGADDNGSGIAVITEALRVLVEQGYRPEKTIQFMGYAAEEVGLRGSKEIAQDYRKKGKNVVAAINFDMTLYPGSPQLPIILTADWTNHPLNEFTAQLIEKYIKVPYAYEKAGYACSDHASWHSNGFPATYPFESLDKNMNPKIHSASDDLNLTQGSVAHTLHFAKLAIAFLIETAK